MSRTNTFPETGKYGLQNQRNRPDNVFAQREEVFIKDSLPMREEIVGRVRQLEHSQAPVGLFGKVKFYGRGDSCGDFNLKWSLPNCMLKGITLAYGIQD